MQKQKTALAASAINPAPSGAISYRSRKKGCQIVTK
jgi:hypothetical protein